MNSRNNSKKCQRRILANFNETRAGLGMHHVSLVCKKDDGTVEAVLNTHPHIGSSIPEKIGLTVSKNTAFIHPATNAINHDDLSPNENPITKCVDVTHLIPDQDAVVESIKEHDRAMSSGKVGFTILPTMATQLMFTVRQTLFSPQVRLSQARTAFWTMDKSKTDELPKFSVTNCADSTADVLESGGLTIPSKHKVFGVFHTPGGNIEYLEKHGNTVFSQDSAGEANQIDLDEYEERFRAVN